MSRRHHKKHHIKLRSFYIWHRYTGIISALVLVLVAVTGVLLNHTEDFEFDSRHVQSSQLLDWYGIEAPENSRTFNTGGHSITLMGEHLYFGQKEIAGNYSELSGAANIRDLVIVAFSNSLLLLSTDGEQIEHLQGRDGVPSGIQRLGIDRFGGLIIESGDGHHQPDADFLNWKQLQSIPESVEWSIPVPLLPGLQSALKAQYRGEILPEERVLLDLHSGRLFGRFGPWIIDVAAILLILLSLSGTWMWLKHRR